MFEWTKDGVSIASTSETIAIAVTPDVEPTSFTSVLNIRPAALIHSGQYTCVVRNEAGSTSTFFNVTVNGTYIESKISPSVQCIMTL